MKYWKRLPLRVKTAFVSSIIITLTVLLTIAGYYFMGTPLLPKSGSMWIHIVAISLIFLILSSSAYFMTYWYVGRPLKRLINIIKIAETKDFLVRAPVDSQDVIGELSDSFNKIMERTTNLDALKIETERRLMYAKEELKSKKELQKKNKRLSLLFEISHRISAATDIDSLLAVLSDVMVKRLGFDEFAILLWDVEQQALLVRHTVGFDEDDKVRNMTFALGEGVCGLAAEKQKMVYVPDTRKEPRYLQYKGAKLQHVSFISIPLVMRDELIGVMNFSRPGVDQFTTEDLELLQAIANQVAVAFNNANLYTETKNLTMMDELTSLHNRRYLHQILPKQIKRAQLESLELTVLMIDIDNFKEYNDAQGHLEGDQVLKDFSKLLMLNLRDSDIVTRFGGDEFLVVLPKTSCEHACQVAVKLNELIRSHKFSNSKGEPIRGFKASIGIGCYPENAATVNDLINHADNALYHAKREGRGLVVRWEKDRFQVCSNPTTSNTP